MSANRQIVREVIRDWSDQPECDMLGAHEEEELTDKIVSDALPAIRAQRDEELRERLERLPAVWERGAKHIKREEARSIFEGGDDV